MTTNRNIFGGSFISAITNKWMIAFFVTAIALVATIVIALTGNSTPAEPPYFEGEETGVYYYDVADGEILITLSGNNKFTIAGPEINKTGTYTIDADGNVVFDFVRDEDGTASGKLTGNDIALTLNGSSMTFTKKVNFTVTFEVYGGSETANVTVTNGKTVSAPENPTKSGYAFLGWFADEACTKAFDFASTVITADTTIYAKWVADPVGVGKYEVSFDLGYDGAPAIDSKTTIAGAIYDVPTPVREGYTFGGWWISMYNDADKLSYKYTDETTFTTDTTLYALWYQAETDKLDAPLVSVHENVITWENVKDAISYRVTVTDSEGNVIVDETVGTTTKNFDFGAQRAGEYTVSVVAVAADATKNSVPTERYRANKTLEQVTKFEVVDGILIFNAVKNATSYVITVDCGNPLHNHTNFNNGASTSFNIANCPMQKGGITVTVTAKADGFASSTSRTYVYERNLDAVENMVYDVTTDSFVWDAVAGAKSYVVTVKVGEKTYVFDNGTKTFFSVASYTGEITVSVVPTNSGFNSPDATSATCTKITPATPTGLTVNGMIVSWDASENATSYEIKIGEIVRTTTETYFDLETVTLQLGTEYAISVKAISGAESSQYSDPVTFGYRVMDPNLVYAHNTVYWTPVIGVSVYKIRVNGDNATAFTVENGQNYAPITLTKEGVNTIEVKFNDYGGSDWVMIEVVAYAVKYMPRNAASERVEYVAYGDALTLPTDYTYDGYNFNGWYTSPSGAAGNGQLYTAGATLSVQDGIVLYADWDPITYNVIIQTEGYDITNLTDKTTYPAIYTKYFTLPVPTSENPAYSTFAGWFTGPAGSGNQLTDANGNSVGKYTFTRDTVAYPFYDTGILSFTLKPDNTYSVGRGPNFDTITDLVVPSSYNGLPVTTIVENAFANRTKLQTVSIPDSIKLVGTGAFSGCSSLKYIDVYEVEGRHEIFYYSDNGALLRNDLGTIYLEVFPRAMTGTYVMSDDIQVILNKTFQYSKIDNVVIGKGVTTVAKYAFYDCANLKTLEFAEGRTVAVTFDPQAFYKCNAIHTIKLPATLAMESTELATVLGRLGALSRIEVEAGSLYYNTTENGMLTNAAKNVLVYCPVVCEGELVIPSGIQEIGASAFTGRKGITSITIPAQVRVIGENAFANCTAVTEITFNGNRNNNLTIANSAFAGMTSLRTVTFKGNEDGTRENGQITIGAEAFSAKLDDETPVTILSTVTFEPGVNVASIGTGAFRNQARLANITYGENAFIGEIGAYAFAGNAELRTIEIPTTTTKVGDYAYTDCIKAKSVVLVGGEGDIDFGDYVFQNCEALTNITLPKTIRTFNASVFAGCSSIRYITVDPENPYIKVDTAGVLYSIDENGNYTQLLFYPEAIIKENGGVVNNIASTVTTISADAFANYTELKEITIGKNITVIGSTAFANCVNLAKVNFEEGGTALVIGAKAFYGCTAITGTSCVLPAYTTEIGTEAFKSCTFTSFTLPAGLVTIGDGAFASNSKITTITIPTKVTSIGNAAFANCTALTTFTLEAGEGASLLTIGSEDAVTTEGAFYKCTKLKTVTLNSRVTSIGAFTFEGITSTLKTVDFGTNLQYIGERAFYKVQLTSVHIPASVTYIGVEAFLDGAKITKTGLTFEMGGTAPLEIGAKAFSGQKLIETITLPNRLDVIYDESLDGSEGTLEVYDLYNRFTGMTALKELNVEPAAEGQKTKFSSIGGIFYKNNEETGVPEVLIFCPDANTGVDGVVTIPKTVRTVARKSFTSVTKITSIVFEEYDSNAPEYGQPLLVIGCEGIYKNVSSSYGVFGNGTTQDASTSSIESISFPSHLAVIGNRAISCTKANLTLTFNKDAEGIELANYAFYFCSAETIDLPKINVLNKGAFYGCKNLTAIDLDIAGSFTAIPDYLFYQCESLTSYTVPKEITSIGGSAFADCIRLHTVTFEEGSALEYIGDWTFSDCIALANINLSACKYLAQLGTMSDTGVGCSFQNCVSLVEIDLSGCENLTYFSLQTFDGCTGLKRFTFPEGIQNMSYNQFRYCSSLEEITLSSTFSPQMLLPVATTVKSNFFGCTSVKKIIVPESNPYFTTDEFGALYDKQKTIVYYFPPKADATGYEIPDTVITISPYAFAFYPGESIEIPEGVETIGNYAFFANKFVTVHIPSTVTSIGSYAFGLNSDSSGIPNGNYNSNGLPSGYLSYNDIYSLKLTTVTFAENSKLESIGYGAFCYAKKLANIKLPDSIKIIDSYAFAYCDSITSIILPASLIDLGTYSFYYCPNLTDITFQEGLQTIGNYAFYNAGTASDKEISIHIPSTVKTIGNYVFYYVKTLTSLTFDPDGELTTIGSNAFASAKLETLVFPPMLTDFGTAFNKSSTIKYIEFTGNAYKELPDKAFQGFTALETVILPDSLTSIGASAFSSVAVDDDLVLKDGATVLPCISLKSIRIPASVTSIGDNAFAGCTSLKTVEFEAGSSLVALGTDIESDAGIFKNTTALETVILPTSLQLIGGHVFQNSAVSNIELPTTLTAIGNSAFENCDGLVEVDLYGNIAHIGNRAFFDCDKLEYATPSFGVEYIGALAFAYCEKLTEAYIPATVTTLVGNPFVGCSGVSEFAISPDNSSYLVSDGILYDINMTTIIYYPASIDTKVVDLSTLGENVDTIAAGAFAGATMEEIIIPAYFGKINANTFQNCPNLTTVTIENGINEICEYAFDGCAKLNNVTIPASVKAVGDWAFGNCTSLTNVSFADVSAETAYILGTHIFDGCTALEEVVLPNFWFATEAEWLNVGNAESNYANSNRKYIPSYMFANTGIVNAVLPEYIQYLTGYGVFSGCTKLETVEFTSQKLITTEVGDYHFYGCSSLKSIELPPTVSTNTPFGDYSFAGCTSLESFTAYYATGGLGIKLVTPPTGTFDGCINLREVNLYRIAASVNTDELFKYAVIGTIQVTDAIAYMFRDCKNLTSFNFADKKSLGAYMFEGSGLTSISAMPNLIGEGAFKNCLDVTDAFIYTYQTSASALTKFNKDVFYGWTEEQNIYFPDVTREELLALIDANTTDGAPTYDEIFNGCNAKIYFKDDIATLEEVKIGSVTGATAGFYAALTADQSLIFKGYTHEELLDEISTFFYTTKAHDTLMSFEQVYNNIMKYVANNSAKLDSIFIASSTAAQKGTALIVYMNNAAAFYGKAVADVTLEQFTAYMLAGPIASTVYKTYDTDGNLLTYNAELKAVTVTNAAGEVIAIHSFAATTEESLTALNLASMAKLEKVYFHAAAFSDIVALMADKDAFAPFVGVTATIYDMDGSTIVTDTATGLIKALYFTAPLNVTTSITGSSTIKWTIQNYDFTKLGAGVTVYITGGLHTYEELLDIGTALNAAFKGCQATVYDSDGNHVIFDANGVIVEVIAADGETVLYPEAPEA